MVTPLTAGKLYFIESDSGDNDDWITDHAGDPDDIDLSLFTEGTDYIELDIPIGFTVGGYTGIVVTPGGAGESFSFMYEARYYTAAVSATAISLAEVALIDKFIMSARHTSSTSYKDHYMIVYFGLNSSSLCMEFVDGDGNQQAYCKGAITPNYIVKWDESSNLTFSLQFKWASVW